MKTPNPPQQLVLASSSKYRKRLLDRLLIPFTTWASNVDETAGAIEAPEPLALRLARAKAQKAASSSPSQDLLIIGSDQVASCDGAMLGKPGTTARATEQLAWCSGKTVHFYTGLAVFRPVHERWHTSVHETKVTLRTLSTAEIDRYIATEQPLDCAGSFKWEALGISLFAELSGDDPTALEGLPLISLCQILRAEGYRLP